MFTFSPDKEIRSDNYYQGIENPVRHPRREKVGPASRLGRVQKRQETCDRENAIVSQQAAVAPADRILGDSWFDSLKQLVD